MLNSVKPYVSVSQYNSIRYAKCVEWNNYDTPKTVENTLSYQEEGINSKDYCQLYQQNDAVRTQFKSSYATNKALLHKCGSDEDPVEIPIIKRTNNLNIVDYRTGTKTDYNGQLAIFFGTGNILDPDDDSVIVSYDIRQYLPEWLNAPGKSILIDGVEKTIIKSQWMDSKGKYVLLFSDSYSGADSEVKVKSVYNKLDYNFFEFDNDFYLLDGKYQIEIVCTDEAFESVRYLSEMLLISDYHENTHQIIYEHDENTQINYSWGIQHMMRLKWEERLAYDPQGESTVHKTDTNTLLLKATVYENYSMELAPLPTAMAIKTTMALSLKNVWIDNRAYVKEELPEVEKLGDANLYSFRTKFVLATDEFVNRSAEFSTMVNNNAMLEYQEGFVQLGNNDSGFLLIG